jgi:uncharacterized protein (TIGR02266 family)
MTIANLSVCYPVATVDDFIEGHALDVSARGLCLEGDRAIGVGTLVEFDIQISGNRSVLTGAGRVAWVRRASASTPDRPPAIGVRFVELDEASQEVLRRLLARKPDAGERYEGEPDASPGPRTPRPPGGRPDSHRPLPPVVAPPRRTPEHPTASTSAAPLPPVSAPPRRGSSLPPPTPPPTVPGASASPALPAVTAPPRKAIAPPLATPADVAEQEEVDRLLDGPMLAQPAASSRTAPTMATADGEPDAIPVDVDMGDTDGFAEPTVIVRRDSPVPPSPGHARPTHVVSEVPPPTSYEHDQGDTPGDSQGTKSRMHVCIRFGGRATSRASTRGGCGG